MPSKILQIAKQKQGKEGKFWKPGTSNPLTQQSDNTSERTRETLSDKDDHISHYNTSSSPISTSPKPLLSKGVMAMKVQLTL